MIIDTIVWYVVAMLCIQCLNMEDDDDDSKWDDLHIGLKALFLTFAPIIFLGIRAKQAFEK